MDACIVRLHEIGAIKFGNFTLKSGIKSPIYIDLRILIAYPKFLGDVADMMWELANDEKYDQICGVPYTALPIATLISRKQNIPMLIKRKEQKTYGTKKQIEGVWKKGDSYLLIEDVIVSGSSVLETVEVLKGENLILSQAIVFIDRQQGGAGNLAKEGISVKSVFTLNNVVNVLSSKGKISPETEETVRTFIKYNSNVPLPFPKYRMNPFKVNIPNPRNLPLMKRIEMVKHSVTKRLFNIMEMKKTNLCVAADVCKAEELLKIADEVGPHICILKTHIDMVENFTLNTIEELKKKSSQYDFLIMEDRKFADIGKTVQNQYANGMYKIGEFSDLVTVHGLPGYGVITGLKSVIKESQACILVAEMSSAGNLCDDNYTKGCVDIAKEYPEIVVGFVAQSEVTTDPSHVIMTPGISMYSSSDRLGQKYKPPCEAIQNGTDIIIVGRPIILDDNMEATAREYKELSYSLFADSRIGIY